jgi:hypothetical protein
VLTGDALQSEPDSICFVFLNRAGVSLLLGDTYFRKNLQDYMGLDLKLAGQLVNANPAHTNCTHARYESPAVGRHHSAVSCNSDVALLPLNVSSDLSGGSRPTSGYSDIKHLDA